MLNIFLFNFYIEFSYSLALIFILKPSPSFLFLVFEGLSCFPTGCQCAVSSLNAILNKPHRLGTPERIQNQFTKKLVVESVAQDTNYRPWCIHAALIKMFFKTS